jgi:N-acetylglutamate synthase-like GNAT family acetyltransferase
MKIRRAQKDDIESIQDVIRESIVTTHKDLYPQEDMEETLNNYTSEKLINLIEDNNYFVAEKNSKIVGCVLTEKNEMRSLYVLPASMRKGIGRRLVDIAEKTIKENGYERVWLWSSLVAYNFYKQMGYKDVKKIPNRDGLLLHIEMEKHL